MAALTERNQLLEKFATSEAELKRLKALGHEEATWRISHEYKVHCEWAEQRRAFMQGEVDVLLPPKPKPKLPVDTPPVVSHRHGRGPASRSTYGEQHG